MAKAYLNEYKATMQSGLPTTSTSLVRGATILCGLWLLAPVACGDSEHSAQTGGASSVGGHSTEIGGAGSLGGGSDSEGGAGGEASATAGASGAANGGSGGATPDPGSAGGGTDGGSPNEQQCGKDEDCSDGRYCNGVERCISKIPGSDVKICWRPAQGPCADRACDELNDRCDCTIADRDGDGFKIEGCAGKGKPWDCDDDDDQRSHGFPEICNLAAPLHDEDCNDSTYADARADLDGDGYYDPRCGNQSELYAWLVLTGNDCDDTDKGVNPRAKEECDGKDNDCNGQVDEVNGPPTGKETPFFRDSDGDHWGDTNNFELSLCRYPPPGYSLLDGDCDDDDPNVNPGREERCNGVDDDCEGSTDRPLTDGTLMFDEPYDGITKFECTGVPGWEVATCPPDRLDCDAKYQNACETIGTTLCNCHGCGNTCSFSCGPTSCEEIVSISPGIYHTCAVAAPSTNGDLGGSAVCWGGNSDGQLGDGTTQDSPIPKRVPGLTQVKAISSGVQYSCAIAAPNDMVYCWGDNSEAQLGSTQAPSKSIYPLGVFTADGAFSDVSQLAAGETHTCAVYQGGKLACWGQGADGRIGDGNLSAHKVAIPSRVRRERAGEQSYVDDAEQVVNGRNHACLLTTAGGVECWGDNALGQLGNGAGSASGVARAVQGLSQVEQLAAGPLHTCALSHGQVRCWGDNTEHELGPEGNSSGTPVLVSGLENTRAIAAGEYFACALSDSGQLRCWGSNDYGELGNDAPGSSSPTTVALPAADKIFAGRSNHACVLTEPRQAWCWGRNTRGQLGDGNASDDSQPLPRKVSPVLGGQLCSGAQ